MNWLTDTWYHPHPLRWLLLPLSGLYRLLVAFRKQLYQRDVLTRHKLPVPVIVVGNISVGGTGKTPFVIWLAEQLQQAGYKPGIISRGYGGKAPHYPFAVHSTASTDESGDEPLLIARRTGCPVVVDPDRSRAGVHLLSHYHCDVIISDDGLQHYALQRDIEISLVDTQRRFGNKLCLPAGPLREPMSRLNSVDFVVYHGNDDTSQHYQMQLQGAECVNLLNPELRLPLSAFAETEVHAIAAIGHPQRFFDSLSQAQLIVHPHAFDDHHRFSSKDLLFGDTQPILMTEKDAVKCQSYAQDNMWFLPVNAVLSQTLATAIIQKLKERHHG